ncbi:ATP-binding protein [Sneathiella limimaris]|uniref:ATP-binding protein n=1 Tax=Sneathiella limimaris TaxID=1964213 RepID=UPI00146D240A|nr:PAS domain-containing sensor histidine kinase [Sneathiella limimaris]
MKLSFAAKVALLYLLISLIWIFGSDRAVEVLLHDYKDIAQNFKGSFFVLATAGIIYFLIRRFEIRTNRDKDLLLQKEKELELAQSISKAGHWRTNLNEDSQEDRVHFSQSILKLLNFSPNTKGYTPQSVFDLMGSEDLENFQSIQQAAILSRAEKPYEVTLTLDTGKKIWVAGKIVPNVDGEGSVSTLFGVAQDVTEQRLMEDKLRQSQKMEAFGQLTSGAAHDFNNLLAIIQGNAELLSEKDEFEDGQNRRMLDTILMATEKGAKLTRSMLTFARRQKLEPTITALEEEIKNTVSILRRTIDETIELRTDIEPNTGHCKVDRVMLENALINMVVNARDAMPYGGSVTLGLRRYEATEPESLLMEELSPGSYLELSISDTGSGMSPETVKKVFEPFFTTKEAGKGTGLGLSMVYGFVKESQGHIDINSELGKGTTIKLYLPNIEQSENQVSNVVSMR